MKMGMSFFKQLRREFAGYNGKKLSQDLMAGLTVAAVALPLALAFGVSAGATAACGLVTAIVAGLVISALTGGYYQISGPTGAMAAILGSLIGAYGMQGMFVATFLAGIMLIIAAVLHLGNLTAFVPAPVITGFTSGIAVIIALGQIDNFFGTHSEGGSAILGSLIGAYGMQGMFVATFLAGIMLIIAAVLHLGNLTAFVPAPVITGFTSGIAVIIALGQIDNFFGTHSEGGSALAKLASYSRLGFHPNMTTTIVALLVVLLMVFFPKKWNAVVPASLVGIIIATAATMIFKLDIATVGDIPKSLMLPDRLSPAQIDWATVPGLLAPAFSIAVLNMLESLLCGASAGRATGVKLNNDQELFAQGVGNMVLPMFGGIPATAALARTSVAVRSGAQTRLTGIFHAVGLLIMMLVLAPIISNVPMAALAGVLMVTAWRMNEWSAIRYVFQHKFKGAMAKFIVTMACTIVFDLTVAIVVGVGLGLILMVARLSKLQINYERVDMSRLRTDNDTLSERYSNAMVAYITGPLLFANIGTLEELPEHIGRCDTLLLSMRGVPSVDVSAAQTLLPMLRELKERGIDVVVCGVPSATMTMLRRAGIVELLGEQSFYWSVERALLDHRPRPLAAFDSAEA